MANDIGICKEVLLLRHSDRKLLFIWWDELRFLHGNMVCVCVFEDTENISFLVEVIKSFRWVLKAGS